MIIKSDLLQLRYLVLMEGLSIPSSNPSSSSNNPSNPPLPDDGICSYRPYVWSILLRVSPTDFPYTKYLDLVALGPSTVYSKIRNDTFRTFTTDPNFKKRVSEEALIRVLNSFAWQKLMDQEKGSKSGGGNNNGNNIGKSKSIESGIKGIKERRLSEIKKDNNKACDSISPKPQQSTLTSISANSNPSSSSNSHNLNLSNSSNSKKIQSALETRNIEFLYIQGMNVLAAPFLYQCKSESQAFALFYTFLTRDCPLYVIPTLTGAHYGIKLVDLCLEVIDPTLFEYLKSKFLIAELYAFTSVLTFSAGTPPLSEALIIWDALFAYGPHLNILFVIAQLTLLRNKLLESSTPMSLLRTFPALKAREIIKLGVSFIPLLPDKLYDLLVRHPYDPTVGVELERRK